MEQINPQLHEYIEKSILPQYRYFDKGHRQDHIECVVKNSLEIAQDYDVNINMVYTIACYHDLGLQFGRKNHNLTSGEYLMLDTTLRKWFESNQLSIMKEAIEDHRASNDYEPRSIYGKIVSEADRVIDVETVLFRTMEYGKENFSTYAFEEQFERSYAHILEKYGPTGYIKLWLYTKANTRGLDEIRSLLSDKNTMRSMCVKYY